MKRTRIMLVSVAALCALSRVATGQEQRIARKDLPPAVERALQAQASGATIRGLSREVEDGRTQYEVELTVHGHAKDVTIDSTGAVVLVEEEIALARCPAAVQAGLKARAGAARIELVETLVKRGKLVAYEGHLDANGKKSEIQVGPDGKPLAHPE